MYGILPTLATSGSNTSSFPQCHKEGLLTLSESVSLPCRALGSLADTRNIGTSQSLSACPVVASSCVIWNGKWASRPQSSKRGFNLGLR